MQLSLYPFQKDVLDRTKGKTRCAYYMDMGLGKTFVGAEKMKRLGARINLIICQKSKITDWIRHFADYYADEFAVYDLTDDQKLEEFAKLSKTAKTVSGGGKKRILGVINYDLAFRRKELGKLKNFTLMLDESSLIQNERAKRSRFILNLNAENMILLSGTPVSGKYEKLWSQCHLLGWKITKERFYDHYIVIEYAINHETGFNIPKVVGYKNVDRLKRKLSEYGAIFMKTEEVLDLPDQQEIGLSVPVTKEYREFMKNDLVWVREKQLIGDTILTKHLYARQLCGQYNQQKIDAFRDLLDSTSDRLIVFYNFVEEYRILRGVCEDADRAVSYINGSGEDLNAYEAVSDSVTLVQYQAGAMGKNLQKANKAVYFTLPERSELYEQSKKRIHRIGQTNTCFYYTLLCKGSIEVHIQKTLAMRKDFTDELFEEWEKGDDQF